ncbi:MAG TPA: ADOP family duplicated permease [Bryobacteraceae bacterium]|nr:ADOP family duplicated permease [Bryobacteraceae bacterium]
MSMLKRAQFDAEMEDEIRFHIETRAEELAERGIPAKAALEQARREFGSRALAMEDSRRAWQIPWLEDFWRDLLYAARGWKGNPGFTAIAVLSLALGVGANCAMFIVVDAMLLRPLAVYHPQEIITIHETSVNGGTQGLSQAQYADLRDHSESFAGLMAFTSFMAGFSPGAGEPAKTRDGQLVSWNYFDVLGVSPSIGRLFSRKDDNVVVISNSLWKAVFHSDEHVIGRQVWIGGAPLTLIGVTPESFIPFDESLTEDYPDYFVPLSTEARVGGDTGMLAVAGRLKPGVALTQVQAEMATIASNRDRKHNLIVQSVVKYRTDGFGGPIAGIVMLFAGCVLLVACANVAGLQIGRAAKRKREIAVRISLGAGRMRLIRQLLTESFLIAFAGGVVGVLLASIPLHVVNTLMAEILQEGERSPLRIDSRVILFSSLVALASVILSGLWPAWHATRPELNVAMNGGDSMRPRGLWGRNALVAGQVAIAFVLLTATGVIFLWLSNAREAVSDSAFDSGNTVAITFDPLVKRFRADEGKRFYESLAVRIQEAAGTNAMTFASAASPMSLQRDGAGSGSVSVSGVVADQHFFDAQAISILRGRGFRGTDGFGAARVAVVNENLAKAVWPGQDPVGKRVRLGGDKEPWTEIVGVARIRNYDGLIVIPSPQLIFLPVDQSNPWPTMTLFVRARGDRTALMAAARNAVHALDARQAIPEAHFWGEQLMSFSKGIGVAGVVLISMGATGIVLALIGLYGMVSYDVSGRTRELGVRMALGAWRGALLRLTMWQGVALALCGILAALLIDHILVQLIIANFPPVQSSGDQVTVQFGDGLFAALGAAILGLAALAAYIPARKATGGDCCAALRCE